MLTHFTWILDSICPSPPQQANDSQQAAGMHLLSLLRWWGLKGMSAILILTVSLRNQKCMTFTNMMFLITLEFGSVLFLF